MTKKRIFPANGIFHIFNRSIAGYKIFRKDETFIRFLETLDYYNSFEYKQKFSIVKQKNNYKFTSLLKDRKQAVIKFICYCIMPDHYHFLIKNLFPGGLSKYLNDVENSFTRYFNTKFGRRGPLWVAPFKAVVIRSNEQLLHVTRYIHLNPSTEGLVDKPENWTYSSYKEYINNPFLLKNYLREISISDPVAYKKFVENNQSYQKKLKLIRKLIIEK